MGSASLRSKVIIVLKINHGCFLTRTISVIILSYHIRFILLAVQCRDITERLVSYRYNLVISSVASLLISCVNKFVSELN